MEIHHTEGENGVALMIGELLQQAGSLAHRSSSKNVIDLTPPTPEDAAVMALHAGPDLPLPPEEDEPGQAAILFGNTLDLADAMVVRMSEVQHVFAKNPTLLEGHFVKKVVGGEHGR